MSKMVRAYKVRIGDELRDEEKDVCFRVEEIIRHGALNMPFAGPTTNKFLEGTYGTLSFPSQLVEVFSREEF